MKSRLGFGLGVAIFVMLLDQFTKWYMVSQVTLPAGGIEVTSFFNIVLVHNDGVSFGLFANDSAAGPWIFAGISLLISLLVVYWMWQAHSRWLLISTGLILGGAIGNVIDRVTRGAVVDFLDFHVGSFSWPAFNVADIAIVVGVFMFAYDSIFKQKD